jgi:hypothetical protein
MRLLKRMEEVLVLNIGDEAIAGHPNARAILRQTCEGGL